MTKVPDVDHADLQPCSHQVGGHMKQGKTFATFTDGKGKFYKAYQDDLRGGREASVYELIFSDDDPPSGSAADLQQLRSFIPKYYGKTTSDEAKLIILDDSCHGYTKPCVIDAKTGFSTIYDWAPEEYKEKNRDKDQKTTQAALGYRICGFQVYQQEKSEYLKPDRQFGKTLTPDTMPDTWKTFASNGSLSPKDIYGGPKGAIAQLKELEQWFETQRSLVFYAASVIIIYEGTATTVEEANVSVKLIDFAHTFPANGQRDDNFLGAMKKMIKLLEEVAEH